MPHARARLPFALFLPVLFLAAGAWPVEAVRQGNPAAAPPVAVARQAPRTPSVPAIVTESQDAQQTRREFDGVLRRYPPALGRVLKLDPALLGNPTYLAPYPGLA